MVKTDYSLKEILYRLPRVTAASLQYGIPITLPVAEATITFNEPDTHKLTTMRKVIILGIDYYKDIIIDLNEGNIRDSNKKFLALDDLLDNLGEILTGTKGGDIYFCDYLEGLNNGGPLTIGGMRHQIDLEHVISITDYTPIKLY